MHEAKIFILYPLDGVMVQAAKVFILASPLHLKEIAQRLKGFSILERGEASGRTVEIGSRVLDLDLSDEELKGTFEENFLISVRYREEVLKVPFTVRTQFSFIKGGGATYLIVASKKARANRIANQFSSLISAEKGFIQEAWIPSETLRRFYEGRMSTVRVIFFSDVRVPNVKKLSLYGQELASTSLYQEYMRLGRVWYVVFEPEDGVVIGLTRNCLVTFFSKIDIEEVMDFIKLRILPMISYKEE